MALQSVKIATPDGATRDVHHRDVAADVGVINQIFASQDYSLKRLKRGEELNDVYSGFVGAGRQPLIIDAGANIGASAVWFGLEFPKALIAAFEPDRKNFKLLKQNSRGLMTELHRAAIGSKDGFADLFDPGEGEWAYRTQTSETGLIQQIGLNRFVRDKVGAGLAPFICKIDIEGAEQELFSGETDWLDLFPLIIIELHDWLLPGQATSRNFIRAMSARDRDFVHIGENIFSIRNSAA
ncbi:MAG: FkbM family methyltransferase [Beijerinckiaceae bacterium]|nr:FkbM family methyltransferase [Beijerinckiaceae bacterium]